MAPRSPIWRVRPFECRLAITGGAFVAAILIVFGAILPAEFNWDPLGLGQRSGRQSLRRAVTDARRHR
jgi:hypothetical protein